MADVSDLINAQHAGSVLDSLAHPAQVNILGAYNAAAGTGANLLNLQKLLAERAVGGAAQGAIDQTTGEYDPNRFRQNLLAAGPQAAFGAQQGLLNNQTLSNDQLNQARAKLLFVQSRAGALLDKDTITPQDVLGVFQQGIASGVLTMPEVARQMQVVQGLDANGLKQWAQQHQLSALQAEAQINQQYGTGGSQTGPGGSTIGTVQQPPRKGGGISAPPQPGAPQGVAPGPGGLVEATVNTPDGPQTIRIPYEQAFPQGGGKGGQPPTPPAPGTTIPGAYQPRPGSQAAPPAAMPPAVAPGAATTPPASASPAASSPVIQTPRGPAITTSAPVGTQADVAAYTQDKATIPDQQTRTQNLGHAYDALAVLKSATGRGAEGINAVRSFAQTLGILPQGAVDEQKLFEIVHKYTERAMIDAAGGASTDMGKRMQEQANAGTLLSTPANFEILRNDMGKALQGMAAYKDHDPNSGGAGYLAHRAQIASNTDPRGFVWNLYSPNEQAKIIAEVEKSKTEDKLYRAIGMAHHLALQPPVSAAR